MDNFAANTKNYGIESAIASATASAFDRCGNASTIVVSQAYFIAYKLHVMFLFCIETS